MLPNKPPVLLMERLGTIALLEVDAMLTTTTAMIAKLIPTVDGVLLPLAPRPLSLELAFLLPIKPPAIPSGTNAMNPLACSCTAEIAMVAKETLTADGVEMTTLDSESVTKLPPEAIPAAQEISVLGMLPA